MPTEQEQKELAIKQFNAALESYGAHRETLLSQAVAFENSQDSHMRKCGKHFHHAVAELDKGIEELEREVEELKKQL